MIFELIMNFIADTDTDENYFGIILSQQMQAQLFFAVLRGCMKIILGINYI